ncbi:hypothetical protein CMV_028819 [Castanea mollissima]|uniref:SPX domain-containing protein n=1 Tax=Castanea mollissima TaxID=60419 RepID=A0A8J4Q7C5_9ROSI|nr:hypothetical protein CMV_028819 [Castanea mollissima]
MLDIQIEKIVLFLLEQQGLLASRLAKLDEQHDALQQQPEISQICELRQAYRAVGQDLLKLLFFVEVNAIGLRKILKKFDKRFGYSFTNYYIKTRANHPYSQLQQVFKHVGIGAVVGAVSRNLHELQDRQGSYLSIYDQPALPLQDPVIDSIKAAVDRLTHSTNFLNFLAQHALIMQEEFPTPVEEQVDDQNYHFMSLLLNLVNTFLYMVNTYIVVPTADDYSLSLGAAATVCGIVIGAMAVAQVFSSVYFSAWSNKTYFRPLVFSSVVLFVGNILYALAYDFNSIAVLLIGRLFCGLGSARAVNRRYISDCVPQKIRMQASAGFVSASALGMACGPALAGLLQTNFKIYKLTFNQDTLPGWVMAVAWLVYLIWLWISFKEPSREIEENHIPQESNAVVVENDALEHGLKQPLLVSSSEVKQQDEDGEQECDESEEAPEDSHRPATSIRSAYRLLTPSVKSFLLAFGGGRMDSCSITEKRGKHQGSIRVGRLGLDWIIACLVELCQWDFSKKHFFKWFHKYHKILEFCSKSNKGGLFVEISEYHNGARRGCFRVPKGMNRGGWAFLETKQHVFFLGKSASRPRKEVAAGGHDKSTGNSRNHVGKNINGDVV